MDLDVIGRSGFDIRLSVSLSEMKEWEPERIAAFFAGLASINAAANPNNWDTQRPVGDVTVPLTGIQVETVVGELGAVRSYDPSQDVN